MEHDLRRMTREQLIEEIEKLRAAIRANRDACCTDGHNLCHYNPELWELLPDKSLIEPKVPGFFTFLIHCILYRWSLK